MKTRRPPFADSVPLTQGEELAADAGWEHWNRAVARQEAAFAATVPASLEPPTDLRWAKTEPATIEALPPVAPQRAAPAAAERSWAPTEPAPIAPLAPKEPPASLFGGLSLVPKGADLETVLAEARRNNRVCPMPTKWVELYRLISDAASTAKRPAPPLTGSAWSSTPALAKRMCFREHIEWAAANECLPSVYSFMQDLREDDWLYMGS